MKLMLHTYLYWYQKIIKISVQNGNQLWYCTIHNGEWVTVVLSQVHDVALILSVATSFSLRHLLCCSQATLRWIISYVSSQRISSGLRSGERTGQVSRPLHPIQRRGCYTSRKWRASAVMWVGAPLCMNQICVCMIDGTDRNKIGSLQESKVLFAC